MTNPTPVPFACCFRFDCPSCGARNYVEPVPCDAETTAAILAQEGHDEGEDWKPKTTQEWTPEFCQMPIVCTCTQCHHAVIPAEGA